MSGPDPTGLAARESGAALGPLPIACPHCGDELTAAERESVRCGRCADSAPTGSVVAEARALLSAATPGPWEVSDDDSLCVWSRATRHFAGVPGEYEPADEPYLALTVDGEATLDEAAASARLIAAAPRRLAALCDEATALRERAERAEARFREATDHVSSLLRREQEQRERAERAERERDQLRETIRTAGEGEHYPRQPELPDTTELRREVHDLLAEWTLPDPDLCSHAEVRLSMLRSVANALEAWEIWRGWDRQCAIHLAARCLCAEGDVRELRERAERAEARFREATDHVSSLLRREQEQRERAERAEARLAPLERVAEAARALAEAHPQHTGGRWDALREALATAAEPRRG